MAQLKKPIIAATELRNSGGVGSRFVGNNGEINASSNKDLAKQVASFLSAVSQHNAKTEAVATQMEKANARRMAITAAFQDPSAHRELGEMLADELYAAGNREGFMRRVCARQELRQGQRPVVKMRMKNVVATVVTSPVQVQAQIVRDNTYTPPEVALIARPFVEEVEIQQSPGDVLNEKFIEAQEGIMVTEDRLWRRLALETVNTSNPMTNIIGSLTPTSLVNLCNQVTRWGIPASTLLMANDLWGDIIGDSGFLEAIDQVSKHEVLMTGQLGTIFGVAVFSDAYRHAEHKVFSKGEMFVVGESVHHGVYTDRGGITSQPIDTSIERVAGRGWVMTELLSLVIANSRSVARAVRIN